MKHVISSRSLFGFTLGMALMLPTLSYAQDYRGGSHGCESYLQGHVAWDYQNSTTWAAENLERLCRRGAGTEPAECFDRVMHGGVDFGGGDRWQWPNAINLCQGTRNAGATVTCFQSMVRTGHPWSEAITTCAGLRGRFPHAEYTSPRVPRMPTAVPLPPFVSDPMMQCRLALQGRVAWNREGDTEWADENIERLCRGGAGDQPARCFDRAVHGFGNGSNLEWPNAITLCRGSRNASATLACYRGQIGVARRWAAITFCSRRSPAVALGFDRNWR